MVIRDCGASRSLLPTPYSLLLTPYSPSSTVYPILPGPSSSLRVFIAYPFVHCTFGRWQKRVRRVQ
ncbi:MAG TPA: hypothetical protein ENN19_07345 [Chloroflexi bacterium]|nr:hypothetical protein [Chloroflexota bacterium]